MRRTTKLALVAVFATAFAAAIFSIFPGPAQYASADSGGSGTPAERLAERLGADDGYALAIHYSADLHGSLETCG